MDVKETNAQVQATCNMLASCAIHLYEAAQGEITLPRDKQPRRKITKERLTNKPLLYTI